MFPQKKGKKAEEEEGRESGRGLGGASVQGRAWKGWSLVVGEETEKAKGELKKREGRAL